MRLDLCGRRSVGHRKSEGLDQQSLCFGAVALRRVNRGKRAEIVEVRSDRGFDRRRKTRNRGQCFVVLSSARVGNEESAPGVRIARAKMQKLLIGSGRFRVLLLLDENTSQTRERVGAF